MRLIDVDILRKEITTTIRESCMSHQWKQGMNYALGLVKAQSIIYPKMGKWIIKNDTERFIAQCNCCRYIEDSRRIKNFCPNCGADMRTKETDCDYEKAVEQLEHDMLYEPTFNQDDGSM